jgi:hypothetical protein
MGIWRKAQDERRLKMEAKALKATRAGIGIVTMRVIGKKDFDFFLNRGWVALAHSGVGYGHSFNEWQMGIKKEDLEIKYADA